MKELNKIFAVLALVLCSAACGQRRSENVVRSFPNMQIPAIVTSQAEWLAVHFWDGFLADTAGKGYRSDSLHVLGVTKAEFEQEFSNFVYICENIGNRADAFEAVRAYARRLAAVPGAMKVAELYLYDPDSPMRDEDLWGEMVAVSNPSDPLVAQCRLNPVGSRATDFVYYDEHGRTCSLYGVQGADFIIVLFGNIECHACKDIKAAFESDGLLQELLESGEVVLVNIPVDDDLSDWEDIYHIRAIPSTYLLDGNQTVLMKDCPTDKLLNALHNVYGR